MWTTAPFFPFDFNLLYLLDSYWMMTLDHSKSQILRYNFLVVDILVSASTESPCLVHASYIRVPPAIENTQCLGRCAVSPRNFGMTVRITSPAMCRSIKAAHIEPSKPRN